MKNTHQLQKWIGISMVSISIFILLLVMFQAINKPSSQSNIVASYTPKQLISAGEMLPIVGTQEQLYQLVKKAYNLQKGPWYGGIFGGRFSEDKAIQATESASSGSINAPQALDHQDTAQASADFSSTNVQVHGVDEADLIKTDGKYLYQLVYDEYGRGKIIISQIYPVDEMHIIKEISFSDTRFYPIQLYFDHKKLVVIGDTHQLLVQPFIEESKSVQSEKNNKSKRIVPAFDSTLTKAYVYDLTDKQSISLEREIELEGNYLSSRKLDQDIYIVTNQYIPIVDYQTGNLRKDIPTPAYKDTTISAEHHFVSTDEMYYFPESPDMRYLNIGGFSLDQTDKPLHVNSYLGGGHDIYGNQDHLFVTITRNDARPNTFSTFKLPSSRAQSTDIYKFSWSKGVTEFVAQGQVPGRLLNQFSMANMTIIFGLQPPMEKAGETMSFLPKIC